MQREVRTQCPDLDSVFVQDRGVVIRLPRDDVGRPRRRGRIRQIQLQRARSIQQIRRPRRDVVDPEPVADHARHRHHVPIGHGQRQAGVRVVHVQMPTLQLEPLRIGCVRIREHLHGRSRRRARELQHRLVGRRQAKVTPHLGIDPPVDRPGDRAVVALHRDVQPFRHRHRPRIIPSRGQNEL